MKAPALPDQHLVNADAERAILAKLIVDDRQWYEISDRLKATDFGVPKHGKIYDAIGALVRDARRVTVSSILGYFGEYQSIDQVSASVYLHSLIAEGENPNTAKVPIREFADIVLHRSGCRQLVVAADKIKNEALSAAMDRPIDDLRQSATKLISDSESDESTDDEKIGSLISKIVLASENARVNGIRNGIKTGFDPVDDLIGTLFDGNLLVIAGETGSGKTALATQLGICLAEQGIPVRMSSLEMESTEVAIRVLATHAAVQTERIADGSVTDEDVARMMHAGEQMFGMPFWLDGKPKQSVGTIQARLARAKKRHGVRVAIIDHLQYVKSDLTRVDERERITQVVDDIKAMAKMLGIIVILISHVSRQVDFALIRTASDIRRPTLNTLFGSSAIEKAADAVLFVHRPHWFLERATPTDKTREQYSADLLKWEGKAELILPKRRSGKGYGLRQVYFNEELTWFSIIELPTLKNDQLEMVGVM